MTKIKRIFMVLSLTLLASCWGGSSGFFSGGKTAVSVEKVLSEEKQADISLAAILAPSEKIELSFPMDVKMEHIGINIGDSVNLGDTLFTLSEQDFNLKMAQLKAQRLEQEALLEKNNYFFKNKDRLLEEGKIDKSVYDALEAEVKSSEAQVQRIRADIAVIENDLKQLAYHAPFAGVVTAKNTANGSPVAARQNFLTLVKSDPMHVVFQLPAANAQAVTKGMNIDVKIEGFEEQVFPATVTHIGAELDAHQTFEVRAVMANPKQVFKGGMAVQVHFVSPQKVKVLSIPSKALLNDNNREYAYIVRQNRAWRVRVYTRKNSINPEQAEVLEGLSEQDLVVTEGQEKLKEGAEINLWR